MSDCPDPMQDMEGYLLWCECNPCDWCGGTGELDGDYDGDERQCPHCEGSGIDPAATQGCDDA